MLKSILYRKDNGVCIVAMPADHQWSAIERGELPTPKGFYFGVAEMEVTDHQLVCEDDQPHPCILMHTLKVNDVDNPTSLMEV